ncbi:MAG: hypothetical protein U0L25_02230 [Ligilactobacillus ruminis]|nr:hypothetical protein [Ligilactobacillus ruminis]
MIKTMLGEMCGTCKVEAHGKCHKSYLIEGECGRFWVSEEELKRIKLPFLGTKDRKMYDKIMDEGLTIEAEATLHKSGKEYPWDPESDVQNVIEAIIKGGYDHHH